FSICDGDNQESETHSSDEKLYKKEGWLRKQYCESELTQKEIAELTGVSKSTISNWMQEHEIKSRSSAESRTDGDLEKLNNEEWLREQYCEREKTLTEIADELNLAHKTVSTSIQEHGIEIRSAAESRTDGDREKLKDEAWLREQYCNREKSAYDIADELNLVQGTVRNWMEKHGIEIRSAAESRTDGNLEPLKNEEWLREQYCQKRKTTYEIADEVGVVSATVRNWMERHGIERRSNAKSRTDGDLAKLNSEEWLREQYCDREKTLAEIADEVNLSTKSIVRGMQEHGIGRRSLSESHTDGDLEKLNNEEWLREQYHEREKTTHEIADEAELSQATVTKWMRKHGIERRSAGSQTDGNLESLKEEEWLREQYCQKRKTIYEIADELNLSRGPVTRWMEVHGIEIRSPAEAQTDGNLEPLKREEWLREQYCEQRNSTYEIANE
ncbi:helix-turn-helix domain-containing protein, partial [Haloquadratum walsbyi]